MLLVLEGCDGSGKSTMARQLEMWWADEPTIHCTKDTPNTLKYFMDIVTRSETSNIIADRFCYGQFIYENPNGVHMTRAELRVLEERMQDIGSKVLYVYARTHEIEKRLYDRVERVFPSVSEIVRRYEEAFFSQDVTKRIASSDMNITPIYTGEAGWGKWNL